MPTSSSSFVPTLSAEVKHILDSPPAWIVRRGNVFLLAGIVVFLVACGFVHYPRLVTGQFQLRPDSRVEVTMPARLQAQLQPGQKVILSLSTFPSEEFGSLTAVVTTPPRAAGNGKVMVLARLEQGFTTTFHKLLPTQRTGEGRAQIITANQRLFEQVVQR